MIRRASYCLLLALFVTGCPSSGQRGSGKQKRELRQVGPFTKIAVGGAFKIEVAAGAARREVALTADDNLLSLIRTEVKAGRLVVSTSKPIDAKVGPSLAIKVPRLEGLSISGAAKGGVTGLGGERFELDVSGAGQLRLAGKVERLEVELSGAAKLEAEELTAAFVKVEGSGAVDVTVRASKSLTAIVSGAGKVAYYGQPTQVKQDLSGVAKLIDKGK